ncbi:DUF2334 domain-containing protein [Paenibacillus sp. LMG 31456]|uniref:DUF2334 domain-containing protein n=1 Tax=Paenibacillus foliorum TaxID=2654974 RepID=A0A972GJY2_9BACL|nr:DUF2334 domain-containing protein [Paenibacillus foliorum]NOU92186.1 DUF2334 domain-containing protein [Paenibacillus foliorum]
MKWLKFVSSALVVCVLFTAYHIITVEGESSNPRVVLMRLEDIGPGGQYGSMEQLGKLRAVLDYLREQHVIYHLAVIPRWIDVSPDGVRYDVSLDQTGNPYVEAYQKLLKQAVGDGATLGMHGYTHQVGNIRRDDGHQESGIGNEFNVPGSEETLTASFAEPRLKAGLAIFKNAGLQPQFWESPHYRSTPEQDQLFRNYFGLHYQADVQIDRNTPVAQYINEPNSGYGASSMGAVYVPTPFDYISFNKDEKVIIDRVGKSNNINSFFYHPFLEFKHLIPVTNDQGEPVLRDGLPEFRYPAQDKSVLQKLIAGLKAKGYKFYSIQDYVPFTPSQRVQIKPTGQQDKLMLGDVTGDGQSDLVNWDSQKGTITVTPGSFRGMRNNAQGTSSVWANVPFKDGAVAALEAGDASAEGKNGLWIMSPTGLLQRFESDSQHFTLQKEWKIAPRNCSNLYVLRQGSGNTVIAGLSSDRLTLFGYYVSKGGEIKPLKPYKFKNELKNELQLRTQDDGTKSLFYARSGAVSGLELSVDKAAMSWKMKKAELNIPNEDGEIRFGDFNGDGKEDVLRWNYEHNRFTVYLHKEADDYELLSVFGPWGSSGSKLITGDLDGNGKTDLALVRLQDGYLDSALSFESK